MDNKVINLEEVMERVQDDKELLLELFDIFSQDYEVKMKKLKTALTEQNFEVIKDLTHSVKGAAGNISAIAVHSTCVEIEKLALTKDIAGIQKAVTVLEGHYKNLQSCMAEIKKKFGA